MVGDEEALMAAVMIPLRDRLGPADGACAGGDRSAARDDCMLAEQWLYRRRRLVAVILAMVTAVGFVRSAGDVAAWLSGDVPPPPATPRSHVVQPGESYWSIANTLSSGGDVRPLVDRLVEINGGAELRAGDTLVLRW